MQTLALHILQSCEEEMKQCLCRYLEPREWILKVYLGSHKLLLWKRQRNCTRWQEVKFFQWWVSSGTADKPEMWVYIFTYTLLYTHIHIIYECIYFETSSYHINYLNLRFVVFPPQLLECWGTEMCYLPWLKWVTVKFQNLRIMDEPTNYRIISF